MECGSLLPLCQGEVSGDAGISNSPRTICCTTSLATPTAVLHLRQRPLGRRCLCGSLYSLNYRSTIAERVVRKCPLCVAFDRSRRRR